MTKILIIEDNEQNMYLFGFLLKKHGFEVFQAINGETGIKLTLETDPDLIIMDWQLPDISGLEVTKRIRSYDNFKSIPIIFCTSNVMPGDKEQAFEAGATGYLEKPINPELFVDEIKMYLIEKKSQY